MTRLDEISARLEAMQKAGEVYAAGSATDRINLDDTVRTTSAVKEHAPADIEALLKVAQAAAAWRETASDEYTVDQHGMAIVRLFAALDELEGGK